jgi:hypothetical protein
MEQLKHKPVIVAGDYRNIDGRNAYESDVESVSIGVMPLNDRNEVNISAKINKNETGESKELLVHHIIDLSILFCKTKAYFREAYRYKNLYNKDQPEIERVGLQGDVMTIKVCTENEMIDEDIDLFYNQLSKDDEFLSERLQILSAALRELEY